MMLPLQSGSVKWGLVGVVGLLALGGGFVGARRLVSQPALAPVDERRWVEVDKVRSGDRLEVKPQDDLLYAGLRAPLPDEPLFEESKQRNAELVGGKKLRLRFDEQERDAKDRLLGYAFLEERMVNETLVREGLAYVRLTPTTQRYAQQLLGAQSQARKAKRGLWKEGDGAAAGELFADPKHGALHQAGCEELKKVPTERLVSCASLDEAFTKGFAPCGKCKPRTPPP
jgi:endonuclease YncB( thermonuclease family)